MFFELSRMEQCIRWFADTVGRFPLSVAQLRRKLHLLTNDFPKVSEIIIIVFFFYYNILHTLYSLYDKTDFVECNEYYSLTTKGGGSIDIGGCRTKRNAEKNQLSIVGGTAAEESEFPHMVNNWISKKKIKIKNTRFLNRYNFVKFSRVNLGSFRIWSSR